MIKRGLLLLGFVFSFFAFSQVKEDLKIPKNPKIGLSLAGGGAKGFAHVGALKVLDSLGIKVDYIAGTSMGSIVGGLYAAGYTGKEIEKIVMDTDFFSLIMAPKSRQESSFFNKNVDKYILSVPLKDGKATLPSSISTGQRNVYLLKELLKNVSDIDDFSKLPIPYMCVATNLETGGMKIFESGDLVTSIMASSAYPSLLEPVKIGDSIYIDGAMTVNYPSKPLKDKGIDIVIGVDLNQPLSKREDLNSAIAILNQVIDFGIQKETINQYNYTDINIQPDLTGQSATSYDNKRVILDNGYKETLKYVDVLEQLPKKDFERVRIASNQNFANTYKIDSLVLVNDKIYATNYVKGKMGLKTPSLQTYDNINTMIDKLYATNNYKFINYDIVQDNGSNYLKLYVTEDEARHFIKFGLHYDEIFKTGLLLNYTAKRLLFKNSIFSLDVVVGDNPRYYFNYFIDNGYIPGFGIYSSGMKFDLKNSKNHTTESWDWFRNEVFLQSVWKDKFAIGGGLSYDYFEASENGQNRIRSKYLNPYLFIKSDTQDDKTFATKGFYLLAQGKAIDPFGTQLDKKPLQVTADLKMNFYISKLFTYRLNLYGGVSIGEELPNFYKYRIGGFFEQNLGNFKRFSGYELGALSGDNVILASNDLQFRFNKNYFVIANFSIANLFDTINVEETIKVNYSSVGISAGYKSPFGQIKLNFSHSLDNRKGIISVILGHWF